MKKSEIAIDIVVFAGTVAVAAYQNWTAKDIIWSLWITSLVLGYSFIIFSSLTIFLYDKARSSRNIIGSKKSSLDNTPPLFFNFNIIVLALVLIRWSSPVKWLIILGSIVFAGLYALRLGSYAVYPVLFFYFFPFGPIVRVFFPKKKSEKHTSK